MPVGTDTELYYICLHKHNLFYYNVHIYIIINVNFKLI